ncbi:hypothetical protein JYK14_06940 [Siccirubricoccus sp. KC 17139]|uniref:Uncharacterized protein n=1 Tax=Siccirubricoccus soli TaxID=2899147 RepID=A0ABT1D1W1_9PROT|nr:hypothetical protein [Siccirubricoccus soli]MCO6415912.1 hypothetical protein [Siccirubricoccus soli]MCP2682044.1 hypothetical protein [Siccirubricoccus soli]
MDATATALPATALPHLPALPARGLLRRLRWWWLRRRSDAILRSLAARHHRPAAPKPAEPGWEARITAIVPGFGLLRLSR